MILYGGHNLVNTTEGHVTHTSKGYSRLYHKIAIQSTLWGALGILRGDKQSRVPLTTRSRTRLHNERRGHILEHFLRTSCRNAGIYRLAYDQRAKLRNLGRGVITSRRKVYRLILCNAISVPSNGQNRGSAFSTRAIRSDSVYNYTHPNVAQLALIKAGGESIKTGLITEYMIYVKRLAALKIIHRYLYRRNRRLSDSHGLTLVPYLRNNANGH